MESLVFDWILVSNLATPPVVNLYYALGDEAELKG
jgi:hypothetical protein